MLPLIFPCIFPRIASNTDFERSKPRNAQPPPPPPRFLCDQSIRVKPAGKKTKGQQRVEMRRIEDKERRQVTFSKRKSGLWKKACEMAVLCRAHVAVVAFSEAGRAFAFASPSADAVLGRYVPVSGDGDAPVPAADDADLDEDHDEVVVTCRAMEEKSKEVAAEAARKKAIGEKVVKAQAQAGKHFWWEVDVEALGAAELPEFTRALRRLKENVRRRADNLLSTLPPPQQ